MVLNAVICDDDKKCVDEVRKYVEQYCCENSITYSIDSFTSAEAVLRCDSVYNIAFLDIEMGEISGLDVAQELKKRNKNIIFIFITGYEKYVDDAMDLFSLRFLGKPLDHTRLLSGLDKAVELINEDVVEFYLSESNDIQKVKENDICYIEIMSHKTKVVLCDRCYYSSEKLDYWEKALTNVSFYRPHKSYVVNMAFIEHYRRNEVVMKNGNVIPVAYRMQSQFRKAFGDYLKRRK